MVRRIIALSAVVLFIAGCGSRIVWSPDGSRGVYFLPGNNDRAWVIDDKGAMISNMSGAKSVAWSADSKILYGAGEDRDPSDEPTTVDTSWLMAATDPSNLDVKTDAGVDSLARAQRLLAPHANTQPSAVNLYRVLALGGGAPATLFRVDGAISQMQISPDGNYLAFTAKKGDHESALYAYAMDSKKLFAIAENASFSFAFTGPARLDYVSIPDHREAGICNVTEMTLDQSVTGAPERKILFRVHAPNEGYLQSAGEDLVVSVAEVEDAMKDQQPTSFWTYSLLVWHRDTKRFTTMTQSAGPVFSVSPDGKHVLFERMSAMPGSLPNLMVGDVGGKVIRIVGPLPASLGDGPFLPTWHGNDEFSYLDQPNAATQPKGTHYNLVVYRLNGKLEMTTVRTLSTTWPAEMTTSR